MQTGPGHMQIVIHAGAHATDEDRLIACLRDNADRLAGLGTRVPDTRLYRETIRDLLNQTDDGLLPENARQSLMNTLCPDAGTGRLVLSNFGFFGTPKMAVGRGRLYPAVETRIHVLSQIFAGHEVQLFLGIRNPATWLPALFANSTAETMEKFLRGRPASAFLWSELVERLRRIWPGMSMTLWCNEDMPLIWPGLIRRMAGLEDGAPFTGEFSFLPEIMTPEGVGKFTAYLADRPDLPEDEKHRVTIAFLEKFSDETRMLEELDLPGWSQTLIDQLSNSYDQDTRKIMGIPGVTFLQP